MRLPSIKYSGPILFTLPVLAVIGAFSFVASWQGERMVNELAGKVMEQTAARVECSVRTYLRNAVLVTDYTASLIAADELDTNRLRAWRPILHRQITANPDINSITFGNADGDATWVIRYPGEEGIEYAICDDRTDQQIVEHRLAEDGSLGATLSRYPYDPRSRPWYEAALEAEGETWSDIYAWVRGEDREATLGIAYARPIADETGRLIGVLDSDVSLLDISGFLREARVSAAGEAMLVDRDGQLIAISADLPVVAPDGARVSAATAAHPLTAALGRRIGAFETIDGARELNVTSGGQAYRFDVRSLKTPWNLDWLLVVALPESEVTGSVAAMRRQAWLLGGSIALATLALGVLASGTLVQPIRRLASAVRRIGEGDLDHRVEVGGHREFAELSAALNTMTVDLKEAMQLRQSLALAMEIQQRLLPSEPPRIDNLDVASHCTYCDETGGDYYDFLEFGRTDAQELVVVLGDVTGHGVGAALLMATARGLFRSRAGSDVALGDLLTHVNRLLVDDTGGVRFMTMVLLVIDAERRSFRLASAGHDPPFLLDASTNRFVEVPDVGGLPLGLYQDIEYDETRQADLAHHLLLIGTDGIWESRNEAGDLYGKDRLRRVMQENAALPAAAIAKAVTEDLHDFRGERRADDDVTFVVVKFA
jgi:sigma-B regulation protein RsbU (phosphoserine phosphatase)